MLRAHARHLERLIARLVGPGADLEDLLQTTLLAIVQAFPRFRGEASLRTWMARIAVNVVRQHFRRPYHRRRAALELVPAELEDPGALPDRVALDRERLARLYQHLASITAKKRIAFVLHVFEGLPIDEVAALTGANRATAKSRVFWARRALLKRAHRDPALRDLIADGGEA